MKIMITEVEKLTGISANDILGGTHRSDVSMVRQLYWKLLREKKGFEISTIAKLSDRTRTGIYKGIRKANDLLETGDKMAVEIWEKIKEIEP
jgi:chromosomal replication initiation ATPase DnaA